MPIGKTELVRRFSLAQLQRFYDRWYQPGLCTLYVVGPFDDGEGGGGEGTAALEALIEATFGGEENELLVRAGGETVAAAATGVAACDMDDGGEGGEEDEAAAAALDASALADATAAAAAAHLTAVEHAAGSAVALSLLLRPRPNSSTVQTHCLDAPPAAPLVIVQHPLLSQVALSLSCKRPLAEYRTASRGDYAAAFLDYVLSAAFEARVSALRQAAARPAFLSIGWDDWPAAGEGCGFRTLSVFAEAVAEEVAEEEGAVEDGEGEGPAPPEAVSRGAWQTAPLLRWQAAVAAGVREALRMARHGIPPNELRLTVAACLKSVNDRAAAADSVDSADIVSELQVRGTMGMGRVTAGRRAPSCRCAGGWAGWRLAP